MSPTGSGYAAIDGSPDLHITALAPFDVEARNASFISHDDREYSATEPSMEYFQHRFDGDHLQFRGPAALTCNGALSLKVLGADVVIRSEENESRITTGRVGDAPTGGTYRWVYLELEGAEVRLSAPGSDVRSGGDRASGVTWTGLATFETTGGQLVSADGLLYEGAGRTDLVGSFSSAMYPLDGAEGVARLADLGGDLRTTTLAASSVPAPQPKGGMSVPLLALVGLAVVAAGSVVGWSRLRRHEKPLDDVHDAPTLDAADAYLKAAETAIAEDNPEGALEAVMLGIEMHTRAGAACEACARGSHQTADLDYQLRLMAGALLEEVGRPWEALAMIENAASIAPEGDSDASYTATRLAASLGEVDRALTHLTLTLQADPALVAWAEEVPEDGPDPLASIRHTPRFREIINHARDLLKDT